MSHITEAEHIMANKIAKAVFDFSAVLNKPEFITNEEANYELTKKVLGLVMLVEDFEVTLQ